MASLGEIKACFKIDGYSLFPLFIEILKNQRSPEVCFIKQNKTNNSCYSCPWIITEAGKMNSQSLNVHCFDVPVKWELLIYRL